jgi:cytochrome P450
MNLIRRIPTRSNRRLDRGEALLEGTIADVLAERERVVVDGAAPTEDFLSLLVEPDAPGGRVQARDEAMTMLVAGHETTAGILAWAGWLLATHPEAQERVRAELDSEVGDRTPGAEDLERLVYLHAVLSEALRLYPPIWAFSRMTAEPYDVGETTVAPDSILLMSPYVTQRDARWFEDPHSFLPERWLGDWRPDRFAYFPFGGGPRMCIGEGFAWTVGKLVLAMIVADWSLEPAGEPPVGDALVTLRPRGGVPLRVSRRRRA